jgi:organic hydroperoxide reductase OsmC/OhrA
MMGTVDPKYTTSVTVSGGRQGHAVSDDGVLVLQLRRPKRNGVSDGTNPEQLFAAAWAGCLGSALIAITRDADTRIFVAIPGVDKARFLELADAAHQVRPYSKATRGNVDTEVTAI